MAPSLPAAAPQPLPDHSRADPTRPLPGGGAALVQPTAEQATQLSDLALHSRAVEHGVPSFGLRIEHDGHVVAYSGDTGPCLALIELSQDADLFVCEAGAAEPQRAHCTPSEAGHAAARAHSHQLLLTHLAHAIDKSHATADAAQTAGCPVGTAQPGMCVVLTADP
jgi:ribonuclease BN (tRNA processing enzyme)